MRVPDPASFLMILLLAFGPQSLADAAREEAERRQRIEEQGVAVKVIELNAAGQVLQGNVTTSTESGIPPRETRAKRESSKNQASVRSYRTALQKLDRSIKETESRLALKRSRMQSVKWAMPKSGKASDRRGKDNPDQLQAEVEELEFKLKQLRDERFEVYEEGKRAGFLPGELDGKGILP